MASIFITGAEGFAGRQLVRLLRQNRYDVVAGVRNRARKLAFEKQQIPALVCDVTDPINVARAIASVRPTGVVHLAGVVGTHPSAANPLYAYQSIVSSCAHVLDGVRRAVPRARVLLVSSADVYGTSATDGSPLSEDAPLQPISTFGSLKRAAENIAHTYYRDYHIDVSIARPFSYTGPKQPEHFFLGAVAQRLANWNPSVDGRELLLPDLDCQRDWLHVNDVVAAYDILLQNGKPNETYNVCSGATHSCRDMVAKMVSQFGLDIQLADFEDGSDGDTLPTLRGDSSKLRHDFNWQPQHSVEDAVRELVASYRAGKPEHAMPPQTPISTYSN